LSGPNNRKRWAVFAATATDIGVLFVRGDPAANTCSLPAEPAAVYRPHAAEGHSGSFMAGAGCVYSDGVRIDCTGDVALGAHCLLLRGAQLHSHRHAFFDGRVPDVTREHGVTPTPLRVGDNVVVAEGAVVLAGVGEIGDHAVVGAHAVLTHPVPPGEIWAGNPARRIGHRDDRNR
jgi:acetyltransferase-like isoleucine patch superfamily enzyme